MVTWIVLTIIIVLIFYIVPFVFDTYCIHVLIHNMKKEEFEAITEFNFMTFIFSSFVPILNIIIAITLITVIKNGRE